MSYTALTYHIVFGTYRRENTIPFDAERLLYQIIYRFCVERGVYVRRIGGMPDHIHILCDIPPKIAVADFVKTLKSETSKFLSANTNFPNWKHWAEGYAAFTIDASLRQKRVEYIMNQKAHHQKNSFNDEYIQLLKENGIETDNV